MNNPTFSNPLGLPQGNVIVASRLFTDEFTAANAISYLNGGILSRMKCVINFYTFLGFENQGLLFTAANNSIQNITTNSTYDFVESGWRIGMNLTVTGTGSNNGSYTITNVTSNIIYVASGITNETNAGGNLYDDTPITALDFYYNLIGNSESVSYLSKTDTNALQKFTVSGLDASDTSTIHNFLVASSSWGWVTNAIANTTTGQTNDVFIKGAGISGHKQSFTLTQYFSVAPFWTAAQLNNFINKQPPSYYLNSALKHIFQLDAKFTASNPNIPYTGGITTENGLGDWFDENNINTRPEYYIDQLIYSNGEIGGGIIDSPKTEGITDVFVSIKSRSGKFILSSTPTKLVLDFCMCELDTSDYTGTEKTLRQNLFNDRIFFDIAHSGLNGEFFGTDYQVLTTLNQDSFQSTAISFTFKIQFSDYIKTFLKSKPDTNRYFYLSLTTQDVLISGTEQSDRVPCLIDFNSISYNKDDGSLLQLVDSFRVNNYPNIDSYNNSLVRGYEGEPVYLQLPFLVKNSLINDVSPTLLNAGIQIVAVKSGEDDVVLEQKIFNTAFIRKLNNVQTIDFNETRGLISYDGDPYNTISLIRNDSFDILNYAGFNFQYAFVLRYEYWLQLVSIAEQFQNILFDSIENPTEQWLSIFSNGWSLKVKFTADVQGYDGHVTNFISYTPITIKASDSAPDIGTTFTTETKYYDINDNEVGVVLTNAITKIVTTFTGDFSALPDGFTSFYGYYFADLLTGQGITQRRFASTEFDSEIGSPFVATIPNPAADSSHSSDNVTINIFGTSSITLETYFDDNKVKWGIVNTNILIGLRLGLLYDGTMLFEDESPMEFEDATLMLYE